MRGIRVPEVCAAIQRADCLRPTFGCGFQMQCNDPLNFSRLAYRFQLQAGGSCTWIIDEVQKQVISCLHGIAAAGSIQRDAESDVFANSLQTMMHKIEQYLRWSSSSSLYTEICAIMVMEQRN